MNYTAFVTCIPLWILAQQPPTPQSQPAVAVDSQTLAKLVADWDRYGLPTPPKDAELVLVEYSAMTVNSDGRAHHPRGLAFQSPHEVDSKRNITNALNEPIGAGADFKPVSVPPVAASIPSESKRHVSFGAAEFNGDLALAVECARRGWNELAAALLRRGLDVENQESPRRSSGVDRGPPTPRAAVAALAWRYWNRQLGRPGSDRAVVCDRLEHLAKLPFGLDTSPNVALVKSLRESMKKSTAEPGSYEAMIDALVQYHPPKENTAFDGFSKNNADPASYDANYYKLWTAGFDAVPAMLAHLDDTRMTQSQIQYRIIRSSNPQPRYYRVCDIVGNIISGLAGGDTTLKRKYLEAEQVNIVDPESAAAWWSSARPMGEEAYLFSLAIPERTSPKPLFRMPEPPMSANIPPEVRKRWEQSRKMEERSHAAAQRNECAAREHFVHVIAAKYSKRLPELYEKATTACPEAGNWLIAALLARSPLPAEIKFPPLVRVASSGSADASRGAMWALADAGYSGLPTLVAKGVNHIPRQWEGNTMEKQARGWTMLVARMSDAAPWDRLAQITKESEPAQRVEIIECLACCGDSPCENREQRIAFLRQFLKDTDVRELPEEDGHGVFIASSWLGTISVQNFAAMQLSHLLGLGPCCEAQATEGEWAALRARIDESLAARDAKPASK